MPNLHDCLWKKHLRTPTMFRWDVLAFRSCTTEIMKGFRGVHDTCFWNSESSRSACPWAKCLVLLTITLVQAGMSISLYIKFWQYAYMRCQVALDNLSMPCLSSKDPYWPYTTDLPVLSVGSEGAAELYNSFSNRCSQIRPWGPEQCTENPQYVTKLLCGMHSGTGNHRLDQPYCKILLGLLIFLDAINCLIP